MATIDQTAIKGTVAIRKLREHKLRNGLPFMINVKELKSNECYLEYPGGNIKLVSMTSHGKEMHVLKELSFNEAQELRERFNFRTVK
jgi:hypothetical protein